MWVLAIAFGWGGVAAAQDVGGGFGAAQLVDGEPDFTSCIESEGDCQDNFFRFLSQSMLEQGLTMQHDPLLASPAVNGHDGVVAGGQLATFPFAEPRENLSGKEENTDYSPVFPRIVAGWLGAPEDGRRWTAGGSFVPPVPVGGAVAVSLSGHGGLGLGPAEGTQGLVELSSSWVLVHAPITATEEQVANRDDFSNPDNLDPEQFEARCGEDVEAGRGGCVDRYRLFNTTVAGGLSWGLGGGWRPWTKLGLTAVSERLYVKYDDTTWALFALQPSLHAGIGWSPGEHLVLALGGVAALRQANQSIDGTVGAFTKLEGAAGWTF